MTQSRPASPAQPIATVTVPAPLRSLSAGAADVRVPASTVGEALDALQDRHPGLRRHLRDEGGELREHINVFVNEDDIRGLNGEATAVTEGDTVTIVPSIAGG